VVIAETQRPRDSSVVGETVRDEQRKHWVNSPVKKMEQKLSMSRVRLDRFLSVGVLKAMSGFHRAEREPFVPILMYHGIRSQSSKRHPYFETNTSPEMFAAHMRFLSENGYRTIGLDDLSRDNFAFDGRNRGVVITFDDGYQDFYIHALPELVRHGFQATVFIVSSFAQNPMEGMGAHRHLDWREIREIAKLGNSIGSHTVSHPNLQRVTRDRLAYEITESKKVIEQEVGLAIDSFAYPYAFPEHDGEFLSALRASLEQSGYDCGVCTRIGTVKSQSERFFMPRIPVNTHDDLRLFEAKMSGAYDWLGLAQMVRKYVTPGNLSARRAQPSGI